MKKRIFLIIFASVVCFFLAKSIIEKRSEASAGDFTVSYLETYKDTAQKKNFEDVKSFISSEQNLLIENSGTPLESNYTDFDNYEIVSIEKTTEGFVAKVRLFKGINSLKKPDGSDIFEIQIIKEDGKLKSQSWYFTQ